MNKFVIAIAGGTPPIRNAITNFVKDEFYYWHWLPDVWLLTTSRAVSAEEIRDALMSLVPGLFVFVTPVASPPRGLFWAMYGPEEWAEWLDKNWR